MKLKTIYYSLLLIFFSLSAGITNAAGSNYNYTNPLKVDSMTAWLSGILAGLQGVVGIIAVMMLVLAGIIYIAAGINSNWMILAKNMATWAIIGFAIVVAVPSLLKEIYDIFNTNPTTSPDIIKEANFFRDILLNVLRFLLTIIGVFALISFVIAGFKYLTSGGDQGRADSAKKMVFYSIIAVLVSGSGVIIIRQIFKILEG